MESLLPLALIMGGIAFIGYHLLKGMISGYTGADKKQMICQNCGTIGQPRIETKGSIAIEIILWLCLIIPGLVYSIWRLCSKYRACPACRSADMIGTDTPRGKLLAEQFTNKA